MMENLEKNLERYEITLKHYNWEHSLLDDPLEIKGVLDKRFIPLSEFLSNMFEKLKEAVLEEEKQRMDFLN